MDEWSAQRAAPMRDGLRRHNALHGQVEWTKQKTLLARSTVRQ
jgi:hypothetical protein